VLKPAFHYVGYIETTLEELWEALTSSAFTTRYWWDTSVISDWKVGSHVSLAINGLVRWHLQRMASNFVEPQESAANGVSCEFDRLAPIAELDEVFR
jgi:hypothetical protein